MMIFKKLPRINSNDVYKMMILIFVIKNLKYILKIERLMLIGLNFNS